MVIIALGVAVYIRRKSIKKKRALRRFLETEVRVACSYISLLKSVGTDLKRNIPYIMHHILCLFCLSHCIKILPCPQLFHSFCFVPW